jgi:LDH2 family malate/lactate/ureidoglycolate dehydrogenase
MYGELDKPRNLGHFMLALDVARFTDPDAFRSQLDVFVREVRAQDPADPSRPPLAPGDPERLTAARRAKEGVPLPGNLVAELNALAGELGVTGL